MFYRIYPRNPGIFLSLLLSLVLGSPEISRAVVVNSVAGLRAAVDAANGGGDRVILIADGTYDVSGIAFTLTSDGITIRGASGKREAVVLDGHYVEAPTSGIFRILASRVTVADLTLKRPYYHAVHIRPPGNRNIAQVTIRNVHIIDPGEQAIKINADARDNATLTANNSTVTGCLIELTDAGRRNLTNGGYLCYTGGIDAHWAADWTVSGNIVKGFWCSDGLSEHGIHFWNHSSNIVIERNLIIDCDRGIGFGLGSDGNSGGIIRNNMIYHGADHGYGDVGIGVESTPNVRVYNNTVYHVHDYSAIEYRFGSTANTFIANNLTNRPIAGRDGASARLLNNFTGARPGWFVNPAVGNLHLARAISGIVDQGFTIDGLTDDFDGEKRPMGRGNEIGADEIPGVSGRETSFLGGILSLLLGW